MESESSKKPIELYSEEVQEILGNPPKGILSWGMIMLFSVIIFLLFGSWLVKYPDIIVSEITLTTENVPANLVAKSSGKITGLFADDNALVMKDQLIAVIENPAVTNDVRHLKEILKDFDIENWLSELTFNKISNQKFVLGEIDPTFSLFRSKLEEYIKFTERNFSAKKIAAIENQLEKFDRLISQMQKQVSVQLEDLSIAKGQFKRDSLLNIQEVLSPSDLELTKINLLQKKSSAQTAETALTNSQIQYSQLEQQVLELKLERSTQDENFILSLKQMLSNLKAAIAQWEQKYALISPVEGKLTFSRIWSLHQNVSSGELVVTVVPDNQGDIIGILRLPISGSGKVKKGERVNVKFHNYPYMEFGMVIGRIEKISLVPDEKSYLAEVSFPDGLITNYGKKLVLLREMTGSAEIITEDMRLIQRFFYPIKSLVKERV